MKKPAELKVDESAFTFGLESLNLEVSNWTPPFLLAVIRWSSDLQGEGSSESRQTQRITDAVRSLAWRDPDRWIIDRGVSAFCRDRSGVTKNFAADSHMGATLKAAADRRLPPDTCLIFENPDRFSRASLDAADGALMTFLRNGYSVYFISLNMLMRPGDQHHPIKRLILILEFWRANMESMRKSKLIIAANRITAQKILAGETVALGVHIPRWVRWNEAKKDYEEDYPAWNTVSDIIQRLLADEPICRLVTDLNRKEVPLCSDN